MADSEDLEATNQALRTQVQELRGELASTRLSVRKQMAKITKEQT